MREYICSELLLRDPSCIYECILYTCWGIFLSKLSMYWVILEVAKVWFFSVFLIFSFIFIKFFKSKWHEVSYPLLLCSKQILSLVPDLVNVFAQVVASPLETPEVKAQIGRAFSHLVSLYGHQMQPLLSNLSPAHANALAAFAPKSWFRVSQWLDFSLHLLQEAFWLSPWLWFFSIGFLFDFVAEIFSNPKAGMLFPCFSWDGWILGGGHHPVRYAYDVLRENHQMGVE